VLDLLHPSLYPLARGVTRVVHAPPAGFDDWQARMGEGEVITEMPGCVARAGGVVMVGNTEVTVFLFCLRAPSVNEYGYSDDQFWSDSYQWLPAEVLIGKESRLRRLLVC
jgi:hypothetical protein